MKQFTPGSTILTFLTHLFLTLFELCSEFVRSTSMKFVSGFQFGTNSLKPMSIIGFRKRTKSSPLGYERRKKV